MDNASKIKQLLQQITGTEQSVFLFRPMEVVSVEGDTCRARYNELEIPGIRLAAIEGGADGGLLLKPATGSIVLVADLSCGELRECSVIGYSEIEALTYRHGDTTVTMNGSNVSATVGRMQLKVTADGVEINGGKQGGLVLAAALRRSLESVQRYCETMRTAVAAGLTGVGIGAAANGGTGAGIFSEQMAAATISLEDLETGDLQIDPRRNDQNVYVQGLQVGEVTIQNQAAILQAMKGELKEYPTLGVGITNIANDHETTGWAREITAQLKADGMRVNDVEVDITNNKLTVDADYDTK